MKFGGVPRWNCFGVLGELGRWKGDRKTDRGSLSHFYYVPPSHTHQYSHPFFFSRHAQSKSCTGPCSGKRLGNPGKRAKTRRGSRGDGQGKAGGKSARKSPRPGSSWVGDDGARHSPRGDFGGARRGIRPRGAQVLLATLARDFSLALVLEFGL